MELPPLKAPLSPCPVRYSSLNRLKRQEECSDKTTSLMQPTQPLKSSAIKKNWKNPTICLLRVWSWWHKSFLIFRILFYPLEKKNISPSVASSVAAARPSAPSKSIRAGYVLRAPSTLTIGQILDRSLSSPRPLAKSARWEDNASMNEERLEIPA